ncbi:hypothetical protein [Herbidospora yilanensis]|uniref:hypothetical protein n=1 Tax=Herbidospora yilanensis TaxID=354426 RepID=UPI000785E73D|nr:hypothetical protein [Herbidospora yilanensis]
MSDQIVWAPSACTLPTAERPLRVAEFDALFAETLQAVRRKSATRLRLELVSAPEHAARAAELAARETGCCSFFTFTVTVAGGGLALEVAVPAEHTSVLEALRARAEAAITS